MRCMSFVSSYQVSDNVAAVKHVVLVYHETHNLRLSYILLAKDKDCLASLVAVP